MPEKLENKFPHQCQQGIGSWSIMGKNLVNVVKERFPCEDKTRVKFAIFYAKNVLQGKLLAVNAVKNIFAAVAILQRLC